ncbi:MAG: hypothetical protein WC309_02820 [Candidatus Paceibacterota bacterium]|jgi:hypothetical protein
MLILGSQTILVPGVWAITKIIQEGGNALPIFNVGVIIGEGVRGVPYTPGHGASPTMTADEFILPFTNTTDLINQAGFEGDANAVTFMRYAKKKGAGKVYFLNVRPLTGMRGGVVQNAVTGAVLTVSIGAGGTGYRVADILTITGGGGNCTLRVATIDTGGVVLTVTIVFAGSGYSTGDGNATTADPAGGSGCTIDIDSVDTGQNCLTFASRDYGAFVNDTSLTIATSIHTIIPPKNCTLLTANSGTGKTIEVGDVGAFKVGETVYLTSNAYAAPVAEVIEAINYDTNEITFEDAISVSALTSDYARIFQEDTDNEEVSDALTTKQLVEEFYATSKYLSVEVSAGITVMPVTKSKTYIQNLTSATKATTPATQASDWQNVADDFNRWNNEFALVNKVYLRVLGLTTTDSANHAAFSALAIAQRALNKPIAVVAGCELGDYALATSNADSSIARARALNDENFQLAEVGLDGYSAGLSLAGELFGMRLANSVNHNQTWDEVVASSVEKFYFQDDADYETRIISGVVTILATKDGFKISQGVNTYQDQSTTFNENTKKTYLIQNRDVADFDLRAMIELLETANGQDGLTKESLANLVVKQSDILVSGGIITSYSITDITKSGNAWTVKRQASVDSPTDFIGLENTILVN